MQPAPQPGRAAAPPLALPGSVSPEEAMALLRDGARMIDVRTPAEHAALRIPGAANRPLALLEPGSLRAASRETVVFHCATGSRTAVQRARLASAAAPARAAILEGGLQAWHAAGLPVETERHPPEPPSRGMTIAAVVLALAAIAAGAALNLFL